MCRHDQVEMWTHSAGWGKGRWNGNKQMDLIYFSLGRRYVVESGCRVLLKIWLSLTKSFGRPFLLKRGFKLLKQSHVLVCKLLWVISSSSAVVRVGTCWLQHGICAICTVMQYKCTNNIEKMKQCSFPLCLSDFRIFFFRVPKVKATQHEL